jgi:hypothetical protein
MNEGQPPQQGDVIGFESSEELQHLFLPTHFVMSMAPYTEEDLR